jgi:hypothetical protein
MLDAIASEKGHRRHHRQCPVRTNLPRCGLFHRRLLVEPLEDRWLLSVAPLNVVLVSDAVAQVQQVCDAAAKDTIAIVYHSDSMTTTGLVDLLASVSTAHNGAPIGHLGIVAHGGPGRLDLGKGDDLSLATMPSQAAALERLRSVLTSDARLDLYSCSVAAGEGGKTFVDELSAVTGAAVFASDDPVGTVPGSDFIWEYQTGQAAASNELFSIQEMETIPGLRLPTVPQFSQQDRAWADDPMIDQLGVTQGTIKEKGCAMTCTAMLAKYYGANTDPKQLNAWLNSHQGYLANSPALIWAKPADYTGGLMTYEDSHSWTSQPPSYSDNDHWSDLKAQLDQGYPVIVKVDGVPSTPFLNEHWVLVTGFLGGSTTNPRNYAINDPWDGTTSTLHRYYDATYDNTFFGIRVYHGVVPTTDTTPPTISAFSVSSTSITVGDSVTVSYRASDTGGSGLKTAALWRTPDDGYGVPNPSAWQQVGSSIDISAHDNGPFQGTFPPDAPPLVGKWWYGVHINDRASPSNWNDERNSQTGGVPGVYGPIQVTVAAAAPVLNISTPAAITEGNTGSKWLWFTVTLSSSSFQTVSVNYATSNGTATAGSDYTATSNALLFSPGQTSEQVYVPILGDYAIEGDETFTMTLSGAVNATIGTSKATGTIQNDDVAGTLTLSSSTYSVNENAGTVTVTVNRSGGLASGAGVNYATGNGTATAGSDFTSTSGTLTFEGGATSMAFTVPITNDSLPEGNETFNVALSSVSGDGTVGTPSSAIITIVDDDLQPTVQFTAASQNGAESIGTMTVTAQLSAVSGINVSVPFTVGGTAKKSDDYTITVSPITIPAGLTTGAITINVVDDNADEPDETVIVTMGTPTNATASGATVHTATILDNDLPPTVQFTAASQNGQESVGTMTVTAQLSAVSGINVSVPFTVGGTAKRPDDYTITASPITIPAGATTGAITINVVDDNADEPDETVIVTMGTPTNATASGTTVHTATILDNDLPPVVVSINREHAYQRLGRSIRGVVQLKCDRGGQERLCFGFFGDNWDD